MTQTIDNKVPNRAGKCMEEELLSQPQMWRSAIAQATDEALLPDDGARVAVIGCGTSWFMAQSYATVRETSGKGLTDAFAASETAVLADRGYDAVIAISRSGTTTEVLDVITGLAGLVPTIAMVGNLDSPIAGAADRVVNLSYADEASVVQTRFATTALVYLLSSLEVDLAAAAAEAENALQEDIDERLLQAEQFTFLGTGWTIGLAHEAALKMREAVQGWTESYPAMEYRHGPISIAGPNRVVWLMGEPVPGLDADVTSADGWFVHGRSHPLVELVKVHRVALERARMRELDPDVPRNLTRSVVLDSQ